MPYGLVLRNERPTSNIERPTSNEKKYQIPNVQPRQGVVSFQPFDSAQGREPVENPELVEVVKRPF
jgi:hypothetical protein